MYGNYDDVCNYNSNTVENFKMSDYCDQYRTTSANDYMQCKQAYNKGFAGQSSKCGDNQGCITGYNGGINDKSQR